MPWRAPPRVDFVRDPQYQWPSWLVGHRMDALFGELHERFNTAPLFLQDHISFHRDVLELAFASEDKADFEARLQKRRDERLEELTSAFESVVGRMFTCTDRPEDDRHIDTIIDLCRDGSFDRLVLHLAGFWAPRDGSEKAPPAQLPSPERDARLLCNEHHITEESTEHSALDNDFGSDTDWDCPTLRYPSPSDSTTLSDPDVETPARQSPQSMPFGNKRKRADEDEESRKRHSREDTEQPTKVHPEISIKSNPKAKGVGTDGQRPTPEYSPLLSPKLEDWDDPRNIQTPDSKGSAPSRRPDILPESVATPTEHADSA